MKETHGEGIADQRKLGSHRSAKRPFPVSHPAVQQPVLPMPDPDPVHSEQNILFPPHSSTPAKPTLTVNKIEPSPLFLNVILY